MISRLAEVRNGNRPGAVMMPPGTGSRNNSTAMAKAMAAMRTDAIRSMIGAAKPALASSDRTSLSSTAGLSWAMAVTLRSGEDWRRQRRGAAAPLANAMATPQAPTGL